MGTGTLGNVYVGVVDDDESLLRSLARLLRAAGMQPTTYSSAEEFRADVRRPQFDRLVLRRSTARNVRARSAESTCGRRRRDAGSLVDRYDDDPKVREQAMAGRCAGFFQKTDAGSKLLDTIRRVVGFPSRPLSSDGLPWLVSNEPNVGSPRVPAEVCKPFTCRLLA